MLARQWRDNNLTTAPQITSGMSVTWRLNQSNFTHEISYSDEPIYIDLQLQEHDGIGDEDTLLNDIWDLMTLPFKAVHWFVKFVKVSRIFDTSVNINPTGMPLKIHPEIPPRSSYKVARFEIWPDGEILAALSDLRGLTSNKHPGRSKS